MIQKAERINKPTEINNATSNLNDFLSGNFQIPNDNLDRISQFIGQDKNLEKIIFELHDMIKTESEYDKLQIKFFDEFQDDELVLEVTALTSLDFKEALSKEDELIHRLYNDFSEKSADKVLILMDV